ncbi:cyclin-dependent kinases regulatory subunit [Sporobolomyces salmoneus]|uniref:cyclin-dependent kinases regulatory subunit n=1 Tax=Sporobolomyces salmoneus TaxID=183962 RepID=UPI00316C1D5E
MPVDEQAYQELVDRIHYSERYSDDDYEYRHVQLPRQMMKLSEYQIISPGLGGMYFEPDSSVMRLLTEDEWRGIGITQSLGWVNYCSSHAPEPHILLFRREKDYQAKYGNAPPK